MIYRVSFYLLTGFIGSTFLGCNSGGDFKSGAAIGVSRNDKSNDDSKDDEDDTADEPVEVSGSFLTCAFMDSETAVVDKAKSDPNGNLEIACGLFRQTGNTFGRVDDSKLKLQARILTNKGKLIPAEYRRLPMGTQMQVITNVPIEQLSGTIHFDYYDPSTGKFSSRRKSIPTITEFSAKVGFSVNDDDSVQRFVTGQFPLNGGLDPLDDEVSETKVNWWDIIIPIIVQVFGQEASVPASHDNGASVYQPKPSSQSRPSGSSNTGTSNNNYPKKPNQQQTKPQPPVLDESVKKPTDDNFEKVDMSKNKPDEPTTPATTVETPAENSNQPGPAVEPGSGNQGETPTNTGGNEPAPQNDPAPAPQPASPPPAASGTE